MNDYKKIGMVFIIIFALLFIPFIEANSENNYEKQGLPIPDGYPEDLVPLMDGFKIVSGAFDNKGDQQEVWVKYMIDIELDKVGDFYNDILSRGNLHNAGKLGNNLYMLDGELGDKTISIKITTEQLYDDYQCNVLISIKGNLEVIDEDDSGSGTVNIDLSTANKNITDSDLLPDGYPVDLIPIYGGSKVTHGEKYDVGLVMLIIQFYSRDDKDSVLDFYKGVLKNADNKEEGVIEKDSGVLYSLAGVIDNYKASFVISDVNIEGFDYKSLINLQVDIFE